MTMMIADVRRHGRGPRPAGGWSSASQNVRALRWLAVEPAVDVDITAGLRGARPGQGRRSRATPGPSVVLGRRLPRAAAARRRRRSPTSARRRTPPASSTTSAGCSTARRYQGVTDMHAMGADGAAGHRDVPARARRAARRRRPAARLLDRVPTRPRTASPCPMRIDRIDFHGPHPEPGARARAAWCGSPRSTRPTPGGNVDLVRDGRVWARLDAVRSTAASRATDARVRRHDLPRGERCSAERRDGYWFVARAVAVERQPRPDHPPLPGPRTSATSTSSLTPKAQRDWLLGRIAVKDAVRDRLWQRGRRRPMFPLEVRVGNDDAGRPLVTRPTAATVRGVAGPPGRGGAWRRSPRRRDVGIDVEVVEPRSDAFAAMVPDRRRAGAAAAAFDHDAWLTAGLDRQGGGGQGRRHRPAGAAQGLRSVESTATGRWSNDRWVHTTQEGDRHCQHRQTAPATAVATAPAPRIPTTGASSATIARLVARGHRRGRRRRPRHRRRQLVQRGHRAREHRVRGPRRAAPADATARGSTSSAGSASSTSTRSST